MHSAPSVSYPVGRSLFAAALLLLGWLAGAGATVLWAVQVQPTGWRLAAAALLLGAVGLLAAHSWWKAAAGTLAWDGDGWTWAAQGSGTVSVSLDLQSWLLLRWEGEGCGRWLWLERAAGAPRWADLRRAVYSRARPQALPGAQPPAAET
jgi:toxin CptA